VTIPDQFNQIATYPIAALDKAPQSDLGKQCVAFVLSDAGQKTLAHYGFITGAATK
jgi:molybdate transport system substrate-binding protein